MGAEGARGAGAGAVGNENIKAQVSSLIFISLYQQIRCYFSISIPEHCLELFDLTSSRRRVRGAGIYGDGRQGFRTALDRFDFWRDDVKPAIVQFSRNLLNGWDKLQTIERRRGV